MAEKRTMRWLSGAALGFALAFALYFASLLPCVEHSSPDWSLLADGVVCVFTDSRPMADVDVALLDEG
jgi:hypothetical protein